MKKNWMVLISGVLMMSFIMACGFSFGETGLSEEEKLQTAVAATVAAMQPSPVPATLAVPIDTVAPIPQPTATQPLPPTATPLPCNAAAFIGETVPDGSDIVVGTEFDKSWRLMNVGTCTWNTNYELYFADGDKMGGPSDVNLTQNVKPGELVDISVSLKAPATVDTYKGFWKVRDDQGKTFVNNLWVEINAKAKLLIFKPEIFEFILQPTPVIDISKLQMPQFEIPNP
jgi:hypothetical protein